MKKEAILFDLDGTLLPMQQDRFTNEYFSELTKKLCPLGYEKNHFMESIWKGTCAMVKNDGSVKNEQLFWDEFAKHMGEDILNLKDELTSFYKNEFNKVKKATSDNLLAKQTLEIARRKANQVVLATNSIFPLCAVETRLCWIGLKPLDFDYITTYENSSFCKPNSNYYKEIMSKINADPINCLMIGNDIEEDAVASGQIGMESFIITDCLISRENELSDARSGTYRELLEYLESL